MQAIGLTLHPGNVKNVEKAIEAIDCFQSQGIRVYVEPLVNSLTSFQCPVLPEDGAAPQELRAMVSLGGDGTLLRAAQYAIKWHVPLLGINLGRLGFLTEVEQSELKNAIELLAKGEYFLEERMLLSIQVDEGLPMLALNDAVVSRGGYARLITMDAFISSDLIGRYIADGIVVSSPTGSTGYSLSAGGPIVSPDVECMVISPICAHTLQHRPVVVSGKETIYLRLDCGSEDQGIQLIVDGQELASLKGQEEIKIQMADQVLQLIRFTQPHFFTLVRKKLTEWSH